MKLKRFLTAILIFAMTATMLPVSSGQTDEVLASATYTAGTDWEKYGNYYFYNQMSIKERTFYDALGERCLTFMTSDEDAEEYVYKNTSYYLVGYVSSDSLTIAQMVQIAKIFKYNNPQYYFLSTMIFPKSSINGISLTTYSKFASGSMRASATSAVSSAIKKAQSSVVMVHDDAAKVKAIHDYIIDLVDYQDVVIKEDTAYSQSIYSVFGDVDGGPVCSGYSGAFMALCNANGIDCISVTSDMHQWNKVRIADTWYNIDLTWDDMGTDDDGKSRRKYTYFCRSNSMLTVLDESDYHTIEDFWTDFLLPECIKDSGSAKDEAGELSAPTSSAVSPGYTAKAVTDTAMYTVSLYTATSGADIYYTTDGRTPEIGSTKSRLYTKPFKVPTNTVVRAVAVRDGYKDSIILKTTITSEMSGGTTVRLADCKVTLNKTKFKYTGVPIKAKVVSVTYKDTVLVEGQDYEIASYDNNTAVGTAKVILSSVPGGNYKGTKTVSYAISAYLLSAPVLYVKNVYCGIRLSWTAVDGAKGYIIERREGDGSFRRIKKITNSKKTAYNDKKTVAGKTYYYRVTAYSKGNKYRKTYCKPLMVYRLPGTTIDTVESSAADSMRVSWLRDKRASGYQVKYVVGSEGRMFDVNKKYTAATVTGLIAGKVYRVYVRSYKKRDGVTIYAKWSPAKKVRVLSSNIKGGFSNGSPRLNQISATGDPLTSSSIAELSNAPCATPKAMIAVPEGTVMHTISGDEIGGGVPAGIKGSAYYSSDWEQYSTYYYYNRLSAKQKKYYRALNSQCLSVLTTDVTISDYIVADGSTYYYLPGIYFTDYGLSAKQALQVIYLFKYSNPQYFFLSSGLLFDDPDTPSAYYLCVYKSFTQGSARTTAVNAIMSTVNSWDEKISAASGEGEKVRVIHDLILDRVSYNFDTYYSNFSNEESVYSQSIYSVLAWSGKKTVCAGYSMAFEFLCNKYGIDAACLTSNSHQWNVVRVDDQWYAVDLTWDDDPYQDGSLPIAYWCFCTTDAYLDALETDSMGADHEEESIYDGLAPECTHDTKSTLTEVGSFYDPSGAVSRPAITFYGTKVTLKASSKKSTIYYTTDGSVPSVASTKSKLYTKPFKIKKGAVVRTIAVRSGYEDSAESRLSYTLSRPTLKSVSSAFGAAAVKWKKQSGITGYEIAYTRGTTTKYVKVSKKYAKKVIKNLTHGKTYSIKIRTYKKSGKTIYYSQWSKAKKVRVQ